MNLVSRSVVAAALAASATLALQAQPRGPQVPPQPPQDVAPPIENGGIFAPGWQGKIDPGQTSAPGTASSWKTPSSPCRAPR